MSSHFHSDILDDDFCVPFRKIVIYDTLVSRWEVSLSTLRGMEVVPEGLEISILHLRSIKEEVVKKLSWVRIP